MEEHGDILIPTPPTPDLAVKAARAAFEGGAWKDFSGRQRRDLLLKLADLVEQNAEELAHMESLDNGAWARGRRGGIRGLRVDWRRCKENRLL